MATDYGGAYGDQPWPDPRPPYSPRPAAGEGKPDPSSHPLGSAGSRPTRAERVLGPSTNRPVPDPAGPGSGWGGPGSGWGGPGSGWGGPGSGWGGPGSAGRAPVTGRAVPAPGLEAPGPGREAPGPDCGGRGTGGAGPGPGGPPGWTPAPAPAPRTAARPRHRTLLVALVALGGLGLLGSLAGVVWQLLPRHFNAAQRQQITDWEYGQRWRTLTAGLIFPAAVSYAPPVALSDDASLRLSARRVGLASQASCTAAVDPAAARVLTADGCAAVLRATYVDGTGSYVVTVGAVVLPGTSPAAAAGRTLTSAASTTGLGPTVRTVSFKNTPAASFTDERRQLSGAVAGGSYVVLYAVGYADDRPKEPVAGAGDNYTEAEMTSAGSGVARAVLAALAAPVPAPHCPGTPGC